MQDETLSADELAEREGYRRHGVGGEPSAEPDVLLDVPQLRVEEIILQVEDLRAHVSVQADVLNLLRLSVGADVQLGGVHLEIKGVEAQALLKVRLDKVAEIINRVLATIDRNPEIVGQIVGPLEAAASELEGTVGRTVDQVAGAVGSAADDLDRSVAATIGEPDQSGATAEEPAGAHVPQPDAEAGPNLTNGRRAARGADRSRSPAPRSDLSEGRRRQRPSKTPRTSSSPPRLGAEHLRVRDAPTTEICFSGIPDYESSTVSRRRNLRDRVSEHVDYYDLRVDYLLTTRLKNGNGT